VISRPREAHAITVRNGVIAGCIGRHEARCRRRALVDREGAKTSLCSNADSAISPRRAPSASRATGEIGELLGLLDRAGTRLPIVTPDLEPHLNWEAGQPRP